MYESLQIFEEVCQEVEVLVNEVGEDMFFFGFDVVEVECCEVLLCMWFVICDSDDNVVCCLVGLMFVGFYCVVWDLIYLSMLVVI